MMPFLVLVIVLILIFGGSVVLSKFLGGLALVVGTIAALGFVVWFATTSGLDVGTVTFLTFALVVGGLFVAAFAAHTIENKDLPPDQQKSFWQRMNENQ